MTAKAIKEEVRKRVYTLADAADWNHLNIEQRSRYYEKWTEAPDIGGLLEKIMPAGSVRVHIKDTIMGCYSRSNRLEIRDLLISMSVSCGKITREYVKPQAILCDGTNLYTLTRAKDWKISLINSFERAKEVKGIKSNIMLIYGHTSRRFVDRSYRSMIENAAGRLDIEVKWIN